MTEDVHAERRERAAARLRGTGADGLVCFPSRNLQYLTGFAEEPAERHLLLVVPAGDRATDEATAVEPAFLVPALYETQVREETTVGAVRTWADGDDPTVAVRDLLDDLGLREGRLLVDDTMWATFTQDLRAAAPDAKWGLASEALADLRVRKDEAELDAMRAAAAAADETVRDLRDLGADAIGMTERDLADRIADRLAAHGGAPSNTSVRVWSEGYPSTRVPKSSTTGSPARISRSPQPWWGFAPFGPAPTIVSKAVPAPP